MCEFVMNNDTCLKRFVGENKMTTVFFFLQNVHEQFYNVKYYIPVGSPTFGVNRSPLPTVY